MPGPPHRHVLPAATAVAATLIVFAGFARTFFLRDHFTSEPITGFLALHGVVFSSWFLLLILQVVLAAAGRLDLHRQVGWLGFAVAAVMVPMGVAVALHAARHPPGAIDPAALEFLATPLFDILVFTVLVGGAFLWRGRSELHKRLILVATIAILPPAIGRTPWDFAATQWGSMGLTDAVLLLVIVADTWTRRRLHPAFLWGGLVLLISQPVRVFLGTTGVWQALAERLTVT